MVAGWNPWFFPKSTGFTSSTFPIQPDFSQNQPAAITLNTGSPRTLVRMPADRPFRNARRSRARKLHGAGHDADSLPSHASTRTACRASASEAGRPAGRSAAAAGRRPTKHARGGASLAPIRWIHFHRSNPTPHPLRSPQPTLSEKIPSFRKIPAPVNADWIRPRTLFIF